MTLMPEFPLFKPIELEDRPTFQEALRFYKPETSELTFTNLFVWRTHYNFQWAICRDWLVVVCSEGANDFCALAPVGPSPGRGEISRMLLEWMGEERGQKKPRIERADARLVSDLDGVGTITMEPVRDHFDYVYLRDDLVQLAGNKYRSKRNHINQLLRTYRCEYAPLGPEHIAECIKVQEKWCELRRCEDDLDLLGEWEAVRAILKSYESLEVQGGVLTIDGKVTAFTIGEMLNEDTAVVHIEKADPEIPGLYPVINQQFCRNNWKNARYINREQDLGVPGLREAKLSYYPDHMIKKFRITLDR